MTALLLQRFRHDLRDMLVLGERQDLLGESTKDDAVL